MMVLERLQMTITWRMRIACWIIKATNTRRIFNTYCLTKQRFLRKSAAMHRQKALRRAVPRWPTANQ